MSVKMRQEVERKIASAAVKAILANGYKISVDNGGDDFEITRSEDEKAVLAAMFAADDDRLYVYELDKVRPLGWVYFVYGNDGYDVISDYTVNLEKLVGEGSEAQRLSDHYGQ